MDRREYFKEYRKRRPDVFKKYNQSPKRQQYLKEYEQRPDVKARHRKNHLIRKYSITEEQYQYMLELQNGLCAICNQPPIGREHFDVDHDKQTGRVRGLLCNNCNVNIIAANTIETLQKALDYLKSGFDGRYIPAAQPADKGA